MPGGDKFRCYNHLVTLDRYSRQILFTGIGEAGQHKLGQSSLVIIGCGALGSVSAEMFTRSGVGRITLIDRDFVEPSNLQRQSLFTESDAEQGLPKAECARRMLKRINSDVEVTAHVTDLNHRNTDLLTRHDVLIDGTDNFTTRYLLNDYAWQCGIPWSYAGCLSSHGMSFLFRPGQTPCLRCLISEAPAPGTLDTCDTAGIIGPAVHAVASFQVTQVLKLLVGGELESRIFQFDVWDDQWRTIQVSAPPDPNCECCAKGEFAFLQGGENEDRVTSLCGRDAVQIVPPGSHQMNLEEIARRLAAAARLIRNDYLLRIFLPEQEITLFQDGRAIIKGTDDPVVARTLYDRYVGR